MGKAKKVELGTYTPTEDIFAKDVHIPHGLGAIPTFVVVMADEFTATTDLSVTYISNAFCSKSTLKASNTATTGIAFYRGNFNGRDTTWQTFENVNYEKFLHADTFEVPHYNVNNSLKAGITYHYVVGIID